MCRRIFAVILVLNMLILSSCSEKFENSEQEKDICPPTQIAASEQITKNENSKQNNPEILDSPATSNSADPETTKATISGEGFLTEIENQVLNMINQERISLGLTELEFDPILQNTARIRSKELCQDENMQNQTLSHTRPDGSQWHTVMTQDIPVPNLVGAGEILAREKTTNGKGTSQEPIPAKDWFLLWKASQPHYDTITWPEAEKIGVGIYYEIRNGEYYTNATVHFGIYSENIIISNSEQN